ncbi:MAG: glutamate 5-kinase [Chitinivibrionales bacterium]|nr:glutamate 5-kinase [Chitinivibrionales bacterium]
MTSRKPEQPMRYREQLPKLRTVVVKVGSRVVTAGHQARYRSRIRHLVDDIARLRADGVRVLLVSSGAIAHGMEMLKLSARPRSVPLQQACAAVGQVRLMDSYTRLFARHELVAGQVLLSWDDLRDKRRYLNLRNTLFQLLDCNAVPVINENDSVGIEEINFGDNDTLGAQMAMLVGAELYVMLTDVGGLYRENPATNSNAEHIPLVHAVTRELHALASGAGSAVGVGGMVTKLKAAEMVTRAGICALIGDGSRGLLSEVLSNADRGTLFLPSSRRMSSRRRWIAFTRHASGSIVVDAGAERAIVGRGKSLLPAGVRRHSGIFKRGDMVTIENEDGNVLGQGLVNYSADELGRIQGHRTSQIQAQLGYKTYDEVIHRDNLVVMEEDT